MNETDKKLQKAEFLLQGRCKECNRLVDKFEHATGCSIGTEEWLESITYRYPFLSPKKKK